MPSLSTPFERDLVLLVSLVYCKVSNIDLMGCLPISKESRLRRLGKQMIRKRLKFWRPISQGVGEMS